MEEQTIDEATAATALNAEELASAIRGNTFPEEEKAQEPTQPQETQNKTKEKDKKTETAQQARQALINRLMSKKAENAKKQDEFIQSGELEDAPEYIQVSLKNLAERANRVFTEVLKIEDQKKVKTKALAEEISMLWELSQEHNIPDDEKKQAKNAYFEAKKELTDEEAPFNKRIAPLQEAGLKALTEMLKRDWKFGMVKDEAGESLLSSEVSAYIEQGLTQASDAWAEANNLLHGLKISIARAKLGEIDFSLTEKYLAGIEKDIEDYNFLRAYDNAQKNIRWLGGCEKAFRALQKIKQRLISLEKNPKNDLTQAKKLFQQGQTLFVEKKFYGDWKKKELGAIQICYQVEKILRDGTAEYRQDATRQQQAHRNREARKEQQRDLAKGGKKRTK